MLQIRAALLFLLLSNFAVAWQSPVSAKPSPAPAKQGLVVEELTTTVVFENDGTGSRHVHAKFHLLSDAAVQQFSVLSFPYMAVNEELRINDVHVRKSDATIVKTSADDIQDLPSEVTRAAPLYSDLHEKHVPVKGLGIGDELEYDVETIIKSPQIPNHFAFEYRPVEDAVVQQETLIAKLPLRASASVRSPSWQPQVHDEGQYKVYEWKASRDEPVPEENRATLESAPAIQITNFQDWKELADWYWQLQKERATPSAAIQAKAAELTKGATSEADKIRAIYNYVALKIRYVGIDFGLGRYQPHAADDVMANQYGDCKDKHTLLASLLAAVGIKAYPVLISTDRKLDATVPSVTQFNHVVSAVKQGTNWIFFDTTPQVSPYPMLLAGLRDKLALLVSDGPSSGLVTTPALPPFDLYDHFTIKAKLGADGVLEGDVRRELRGDSEVLLRLAFRNTPESKWQDLVQRISYFSGFAGDVSSVTVSDPDDTEKPFLITYHYHRKDYGDWENHRIGAPMPFIAMPKREELKLKANQPLRLSAEHADYESTVELPKGFSAQPPPAVRIRNELADFDSTFSVKNGIFTATRKLKFNEQQVPPAQDAAYDAVRKKVTDDYATMMDLSEVGGEAFSAGIAPGTQNQADGLIQKSEEADSLMRHAQSSAQRGDILGAQRLLQQVTKIDPAHPKAWLMLGSTYMMRGDVEQGLSDMRKEVSLHPDDIASYKALGFALMALKRDREAEQVWRDLLQHASDDRDAAANLGSVLMRQKKYSEAYVEYQSAVKVNPDSAVLYNGLGVAGLHSGNIQQGSAALDKAVELDPELRNDVAYELAEDKQSLDKALLYAKQAVAEEEKKASSLTLQSLETTDLGTIARLGPYWDTLGWVYFQMGDLENARKFLLAAWNLSQYPTEGDHLGQLYERQHDSTKAAEMYALALAVNDRVSETRERLSKLLASEVKVDQQLAAARDKISRLREIRIPRKAAAKGTAEFFVLLSQGSKVEDVKFITGDQSLQWATKEIASAKFDQTVPDESDTKIVRRGILDCTTLGCDFVLLNPGDVRSVE